MPGFEICLIAGFVCFVACLMAFMCESAWGCVFLAGAVILGGYGITGLVRETRVEDRITNAVVHDLRAQGYVLEDEDVTVEGTKILDATVVNRSNCLLYVEVIWQNGRYVLNGRGIPAPKDMQPAGAICTPLPS